MASVKLPTYVFRGTTLGYPGNDTSIEHSFCCTSSHPLKALWFALECSHYNKEPVVYIAEPKNFKNGLAITNVLKKIEDEISFNIVPEAFYAQCLGYVLVKDFQNVLSGFGLDSFQLVRIDNLSRLCKETKPMSVKQIKELVESLLPYIKSK